MTANDTDILFSPARPTRPLTRLRRLAVLLFVGLCLVGGSYLRFSNIGKNGFWTDEFFHVFAAQSYLRDGSLNVPLHGEYTRAVPITYITAWSFKHFGVSEASARSPFAAVNVLFLLVAFLFIRRLFGLLPALATLGVLSFAPFMLHMSRECRMYTVFQLLYFSWIACFILGFEPVRRRAGWEGRLNIDIRWLVAATILLPVSIEIHDLGWNGGLVVATYIGVVFLWEARSKSLRQAVLSKYGLMFGVIALLSLAMIMFKRDDLRDMIQGAQEVPYWSIVGSNASSFYRYFLSETYPALFFIYPLACFSFVRLYRRRGLFMVISFSLLFILHSYVFGRKGDRYIFYIFPFFVLVSATFMARALEFFARHLRAALAAAPLSVKAAAWGCALPALYLVTFPWLSLALRAPNTYVEIDWKAAAQEIREKSKGEIVIDTSPMPYLYYLGTLPDYYMLGEVWDVHAHAGRLVQNAAELTAALDKPGLSVLVTDQGRIGNPAFLNRDMEAVLDSRTHLEYSKIDRRIRYYEELPAPTTSRHP